MLSTVQFFWAEVKGHHSKSRYCDMMILFAFYVVVWFLALPQLPVVQQLGTVLRLLSAYNVVLPSLYAAGGAIDLWTLMDGVQHAVSDDSSSSSLASSKLRLDLLRLFVATSIPAKQLLKMVSDD